MTQANPQPAARPAGAPPPPTGAARQANVPLILIAVGLGLVTVIANAWYVNNIRTQAAQNEVIFYKLNRSVDPGEKLRKRDLIEVSIPAELADSVTAGFGAIEKDRLDTQIGQEFKRFAKDKSLLTFELFTLPGQDGDQVQPKEGKRSLTLPVSTEWTPRTLNPDDWVDVSAILKLPGRRTQSVLIMERVRVLGVGDRMVGGHSGGRRRSFSNITIEVTADESRHLATIGQYAVNNEFTLVERNPSDSDEVIKSGSINPDVMQALGLKNSAP